MQNKTLLVTGATGSFGKAFVKLVLTLNPHKVICFSRGEEKQVEMRRQFNDERLRFFIGDVRDRQRLWRALNGVDYVVHAAALKHVDVAEADPIECIRTNVDGAANVIDMAIDRRAKKVLAVSTDKAVNPCSLYGAAKLVADKLVCAANTYSPGATAFSVIRYGNFVGSSESVIPYFQRLIASGQRWLPITDFRMTRFFISLSDAAQRALDALGEMQGGEIYCPKMSACRIVDLAQWVKPDIELREIGTRPGEKLHEEMVLPGTRGVTETEHFYTINGRQGTSVDSGFSYSSDQEVREWVAM